MNGQSQIYLPRLTPINKIIIIISSVLFLMEFGIQKGMGGSLFPYLGLSAQGINSGFLHTLLTYPFMSHSFMEVILNCLMLWLMGSEFEDNWGRSRYLKFMAAVILGGAVFYLAVSYLFFTGNFIFSFPLVGLSGVVSALCVAYAVIYPTRIFSFMMLIPIQAKYFCLLLTAIALFQGISSPLGIGAWGQLGAIASGFLFMWLVSNRDFKILSQKIAQISKFSTQKKSKAKLTLVKGDDDKPPKYWQ